MMLWHYENVLKPQIDKLPSKIKSLLWHELMSELEFKEVYESIIGFNMSHRSDIEALKKSANKEVLTSMLSEYPLTREDCVIKEARKLGSDYFKVGDKVKIHCCQKRDKGCMRIYENNVGTITHIWDLNNNPWGNIEIILPNGCISGFYADELELVNE